MIRNSMISRSPNETSRLGRWGRAWVVMVIAVAGAVGCRSLGDREVISAYPFVDASEPHEPQTPNAAGPFLRALPGTSEGAPHNYFPTADAAFYDRVTGRPTRAMAPGSAASAFWPLDRFYDLGETHTQTEIEALGEIFRYKKGMYGPTDEIAFSPLFRYYNDPANHRKDVDVLWPLVQYRLTENNEKFWVLPIFYFDRFKHADGRDDLDVFIMPFIFFGVERFPRDDGPTDRLFWLDRNHDGQLSRDEVPRLSRETFAEFDADGNGMISRDEATAKLSIPPREESYFAAVPFGGTLRGFLLADWAEFYLFPLFYHQRKGDYHSYYAPWPIVHWGYGGGRKSLHVLPFFSMDVKRELIRHPDGRLVEGPIIREAYAVLWPIIQWQNMYGETNVSTNPRRPKWERSTIMRSQMVFPFYSHLQTPRRETTSILWPFFNVQRDYDRDYISVDAPWPIFRYASGIGESEFRIWPLFHHIRKVGDAGSLDEQIAVLWPIIFYDHHVTPYADEETFKIIPIFWHTTIQHFFPSDGSPAGTEQWTKLWPLFGYTRERDGTEKFEFISPLPMAKVDGFENNWAMFWRLFYWERSGDGSSVKWNALGPLIRYEEDRHRTAFDFFPLIQHRSGWTEGPAPVHTSSTDLLYGLVGWGEDMKGSYLRLLWFIKIYLSDREDVPASQIPSGSGSARE